MTLRWEGIKSIVEEEVCNEINARADVKVQGIVLTASDESVESRLRQREIGTDLERHLVSSKKMARILDQFTATCTRIPVSRIPTDCREVSHIADEVVDLIVREATDAVDQV